MMKYKFYQIKDVGNTPYTFRCWDSAKKKFNINDYKLVYSGEIEKKNCLEELFIKFNLYHPADFSAHSMSVSDVVALKDDNRDYWYWYYCDDCGWEEITEYIDKATEVTTVGYYGNDGIIHSANFNTHDEKELATIWWEFCKENNIISITKSESKEEK